MKKKNFLTYMNLLDDRYIEEADPCVEAAYDPHKLRRARSRRRIPLLIAATVSLVALLVVGTFATFNDWGSYLSLVFKGNVELLDDYTVTAKNVTYTSTNEDVKMEIVGYTGDQNYAYVWVKVTPPKAILEQYGKENFDTLAFTTATHPRSPLEFVGGKVVGNAYVFEVLLCANEFVSGELTLDGQQVELSFENIRVFGLDGSERKIDGHWTASFCLDVPDMSLTLSPPVEGLLFCGHGINDAPPNEIQADTCTVELSPMSVRLTVTYERPADLNHAYYDPTREITLILADGTRLENYSYGSQITYDADISLPGTERAEIIGLFHHAFNPHDVVAIEYAGARIELK